MGLADGMAWEKEHGSPEPEKTYHIFIGANPKPIIAHSFAEIEKVLGDAPFGATYEVRDAKTGYLVQDFIPF